MDDELILLLAVFLMGAVLGFAGLKSYEYIRSETSCEMQGRYEICVDKYVWENIYLKEVR